MKITLSCVIKRCKFNGDKPTKSDLGVIYHRFPTITSMKQQWLKIVRIVNNDPAWCPPKICFVCALHFEDSDYCDTSDGQRRIRLDAVPTKFQFAKNNDIEEVEQVSDDSCMEITQDVQELNDSCTEMTQDIQEPIENCTRTLKDCMSEARKYIIAENITGEERKLMYSCVNQSLMQKLHKCRRRIQIQREKIKALSKREKRLQNRHNALKSIVEMLTKDTFQLGVTKKDSTATEAEKSTAENTVENIIAE